MWSTEVWDKMKFFFPENGNGSRIVITTRISNMAISCSSFSFEMNFLNEDNSWKLFCEKAFGEEDCPDELMNIGKMIVEQCRGLPLSIVVIGGHLRKSSRTREHWENVANDMKSILNSGEDEQCLNILSLSYTHLPAYLKPCFLYMGIFPEDDEIRVSRLIKLWIAEGFLRPYENQSLEEVAKEYLKDLVDRNLILVRQWSQNEKIRTCSIHDLLREVCLKVAEKEKFLCVLKSVDNPRPLYSDRRAAVHGGLLSKKYSPDGNFYWYPRVFDALCSAPFVRSLICNAWHLSFDFLKLMRILDRVHDTVDICDVRRLAAKFQQVNLRYLDREFWWGRPRDDMDPYPRLYLPSSISRLWSLQTLIIRGSGLQFFAPREIWELPMLRHLLVSSCIYLPDPPPSDQQDVLILRNLQTLSRLTNFKLSDEVCKRIPNIKKLRIWYDFESNPSSYYNFNNLGRFHELESLSCGFADESDWCDFSLSLTLPCSLRKVSLTHCFLDWKDLTVFSSLPCLEVLKLEFGRDAVGHEWNPIAGGFPRLKSLMIWASNLIYWNADNSHFPVLKNLTLRYVSKLDVIPSGIGEIPTLRQITMVDCSVSASISAMRMLMEQEELGNDGFLLDVQIWNRQNAESFKEMLREEGLKSNNIRLDIQGRPYSRMQEDDADI